MNKAGLRRLIKAKRQKLNSDDVKHLSQAIINNIWPIINWVELHSIHSYLPISKNNEVDTLPLLKAARQINPALKIATTDPTSSETFWLDDNFKPGKKVREGFRYGLVIVPMIGFDKAGYRLGYGGGFYDRFLPVQDNAVVIGLCYELGFVPKLPHDIYDFPLSTIVTEKVIRKF